MRVIESSVEIIKQEPGIEGIYKIIEFAGRICYASTPKDKENSGKKFFDRMVSLGHLGVIEHGSVYLAFKEWDDDTEILSDSYHSDVVYCNETHMHLVTTNMRVLVEEGIEHLLESYAFCDEPMKNHVKRTTVLFHTDRITGESFIRHRTLDGVPNALEINPYIDPEWFSFCRQSTRYCNYNLGKFGGEITVVAPTGLKGDGLEYNMWAEACIYAENRYLDLIDAKVKPEVARYVLPFSLYSPLVMTGTRDKWDKFFALRCNEHAHPDAQKLGYELIRMM